VVGLGGAARRHPAQHRRRVDRAAAGARLHRRAATGQPALHVWLCAGEDLAGIAIVAVIAISALAAGYEAIERLINPHQVSHLGAVAAAAIIGFLGNEAVARLRITVGRRIGSAALVADGLHARADGFTSLAVLVGAGGVALGWSWADPAVGLAITVAILFVLKDAAREVYRRLMDAVDPSIVDACEAALRSTPGVLDVPELRLRWLGHRLRASARSSSTAGSR